MTTSRLVTSISTVILAIYGLPVLAAGEAAQVIFTNDKLIVIDAKGIERAVKQGDFIQPGERVVTSPGVIGQIRLPDGTLLGARPGTDIKLESFLGAIDKNVLVLNEGNVRVINLESSRGPKPLPVDIVSPNSTMKLSGGDGETIHVKVGDRRNADPGTYTRLQMGVASLSNPTGNLKLSPLQSSFVPKVGVAPTVIAAFPISLAGAAIPPVLTTTTTKLATTTSTTSLALPSLSTFSTQLIAPTTTTGSTSTTSTNLLSSTTLAATISKDINLATTSLASPTMTTTTTTSSNLLATNTLTTTKATSTITPSSPTLSTAISPTFTAIAPITTTYVKPPTTTYIAPTTTTLKILSTRTF